MLTSLFVVALVGFAQANVGDRCADNSECGANECCVNRLMPITINTGTSVGDAKPKRGVCDMSRQLKERESCYNGRIVYPKDYLPYQCLGKCGAGLTCKNHRCADLNTLNKPEQKKCRRHSDCAAGECCQKDLRLPYYEPAVCMANKARTLRINSKCLPNARRMTPLYQCPVECVVGTSCQKFDHNKFSIPGDMGHLFDEVYHCAVDTTKTNSATAKPPAFTTVSPPETTMDPGSGEEINTVSLE